MAGIAAVAVLAAPASGLAAPRTRLGTPPRGSGIGTSAALQNPKCTAGDAYGRYGRFPGFTHAAQGTGQVCVRPWKRGGDNGGATSRGVTRTRVRVVAIVPNDEQFSLLVPRGAAPINRATNAMGSVPDALHDALLAQLEFVETWGRDIELRFVTSSGGDEAAQRADAVTVEGLEPFAVLDVAVVGLPVLDAELAKAKILVFGNATNTHNALAQAPYRWGPTDTGAAAINAAEVIGKQLVGERAEFGGDDVKSHARRFGTVFINDADDPQRFENALRRYGASVASANGYDAPGSPSGDPTTAQEQAPAIATRMKAAGVTTVVLFSDAAMNTALMKQATAQQWYPEWFFTGTLAQEIAVLARGYPREQSRHAFGMANLGPSVSQDPQTQQLNVLNWYWGEGVGTGGGTDSGALLWLLGGIQAAGPHLTPQTFRQGWFAAPARNGAADAQPVCCMIAYGKTGGLPYDSYATGATDFSLIWWDNDTVGPSQWPITMSGQGVARYLDGAKRYRAGSWPTQQIKWFDRSAVVQFDTQPVQRVYVGDCTSCPSHGGPGTPGTPAPTGFVAKAGGAGTRAR